jgi:hypothetical protein
MSPEAKGQGPHIRSHIATVPASLAPSLSNRQTDEICIKEMAMKKTTVVIDEELLKAAIEAELRSLVRNRNREALRRELGTFEIDLTSDALERLRNAK